MIGYIAAGIAGWIILASLGGFAWSFVATRMKRVTPPKPPPPPEPHVCDDCLLRREFTSIISAEWEWSE